MTARKPLSKKTRFDVFKRDGFCCQYCGATPPDILLQVDHIEAVANGGQNDMDNLVTACQPCNLGKGARPLTLVPQSLADKAADIAEREEQLRGYAHVMEARRERREDEMWRIAEVLSPGCSEKGMSKDWLRSITKFIDQLGLYVVLEAAELARDRKSCTGSWRFRYFCGICWNKVRNQ